MSFIKAENALKRSEELLAVGRPVEALETLRSALFTRRFRFSWTEAMEEIVKSYVRLSFELREVRNLKEGFLQYRSAGNYSSFDRCVRFLLEHAESRVTQAAESLTLAVSDVSLEETERPEALLLRAFGEEQEADFSARGKSALRDLWEAFRTALDLTRAHAPFEDLYHEIARRACGFCSMYKRTSEFRRLCELLRLHYSYLPRQAVAAVAGSSMSGPQVVSGSNAETIGKQLETRMSQLSVALELNLYSVAYAVAEDVQSLMTKRKPNVNFLKTYFCRLADLFDSTNSPLFHAYALLRHATLARAANDEAKSADIMQSADRVVLACMAADYQTIDSLSSIADLDILNEKNSKLAALLSAGGAVPTSDLLFTELVTKGLLTIASKSVQVAFYNLVEGDGSDVYRLLLQDNARNQITSEYLPRITKALFVRNLRTAATVFSRMPLAAFKERLCKHITFPEVERILLNLRRSSLGIDVHVDYESEIVHFSKSTGNRVRDFSALAILPVDLQEDRLCIAETAKVVKLKQRELAETEAELEKSRLANVAAQQERDKEMLRKLKEEEVCRKETELREKIRFAREMEKAKDLDERLKDEKLRKEYLSAADSKTLTLIVKEMEKTLERRIKKEISMKLQLRKSEFKKVNLTAKVLRYEEAKKIHSELKPSIIAQDRAFYEATRQRESEDLLTQERKKTQLRELLKNAVGILENFKAEKLQDRQAKVQAKLQKARQVHQETFAREAIDIVWKKLNANLLHDEEYYEEMARAGQSCDILRADTQSRDDFKADGK